MERTVPTRFAEIGIYGVCRENVHFSRLHVALRGATADAAIEGIPGPPYRAVIRAEDATLNLSDLTIRNGSGGGVVAIRSIVGVSDSRITENQSGGIGLVGSRGEIQHTLIDSNIGDGIVAVEQSSISVNGCEIVSNRGAAESGGSGAGVRLFENSVGRIWGGTFSDNLIGAQAGTGCHLIAQNGNFEFARFLDNEFAALAGGSGARIDVYGPELTGWVVAFDDTMIRIESSTLDGDILALQFSRGIVGRGAVVSGTVACDVTSDLLCNDASLGAVEGCGNCPAVTASPETSSSTRSTGDETPPRMPGLDGLRRITRPSWLR